MNEQQITKTDSRSFIQRSRVSLGFITAILFVVFSQPSWWLIAIGFPVALAGALFRVWASGHLRKNAELTVSGPYAFTRNPLYFGSFLMAAGCAVCGGSIWLGVWLLIFFLAVYLPVIQAESAHMKSLFGDSYETWAANVPLFIPRVIPYQNGQVRDFDLRQFLHHREYRALIGLAIVIAILSFKAAKLPLF